MINALFINLVSVGIFLEWSLNINFHVVSLHVSKNSEFSTESFQVESCNFLIKSLWKSVNLTVFVFVAVLVLPQVNLSKDLVGEGGGHNEAWMSSGATQVQESSLGENDDSVTIRELIDISSILDVDSLDSWVVSESLHVDFVIEMADVTDNSIVLHLCHVADHDDVLVTGSSDEDISLRDNSFESNNFETFHAGLKSTDRVNFSDIDTSTSSLHGSSTAFADVTVAADDSLLSGNHDISGSHNTINKRVSATVDVVELALGDRVIDIDGSERQSSLFRKLVKSQNTSGGFFRDTNEILGKSLKESWLSFHKLDNKLEEFLLVFTFSFSWVRKGSVFGEFFFPFKTFNQENSGITTVINNGSRAETSWEGKSLESVFPVFFKGFSLDGEDFCATFVNNCSSSVILSGIDVARAPSDISSECLQGVNQNGSLDSHVE
mmetsp:Transcript_32869/g.38137  ORF Transcript_32869/g.38137 Transcript_32869/m.38137 type:complete len:436 (-) Transcript_32869:75-1382(-)